MHLKDTTSALSMPSLSSFGVAGTGNIMYLIPGMRGPCIT